MDLRIFNTMIYDRQRIEGSKTSFFHESMDNDESVTNNTEELIVNWIFNHKSTARFFASHFATDLLNLRAYSGLTKPFTTNNQKPGDIDLLFVDPYSPNKSIAFEVKKVKALAIDNEVSKVNGSEKIIKGVMQVNRYQSIGFHRTYLLVIILNDGRAKNTPNVMLRKANSKDVTRVYNIPWNEPLHEDVGITFLDINQFTGRHINQTGSLGLCIDKEASWLDQTYELTLKINQ